MAPKDRNALGGCCGLRPAASAGGRVARHRTGAVVAEVGLFRATTGVRIRQSERGALSLADFLTTTVAHENGLASQVESSFSK
jgi:hypothetical protein